MYATTMLLTFFEWAFLDEKIKIIFLQYEPLHWHLY